MAILDALLAATGPGTPFIFKEPLGQAREVTFINGSAERTDREGDASDL
jgi:hypothetical protein